jgi:Tol biopolymer transport system component
VGRRVAAVRVAAVLLVAVSRPVAGQAPDDVWRTITTEHFRVTFSEGLEPLGRKAADRAERAWRQLEENFIEPPDGTIDILLTDHTDTSNGYAQVYPSNRITIFARPPVDLPSVGHNDEWMELVITHELAHIVHLDHVTNPIGRAARSVFGRVNADWPFFPELGTPRWLVEGLATWYESRLTDAGRLRGTYLEMQLRTAMLEGRFESIGQAGGESPLMPAGNRPYAYGSLFFEFLLDRHGPESMSAFVDAIGGQWIPYRLDAAARDAFGVSLSDEWHAWRDSLQADVDGLDARLREAGPITEPERLTEGARWGLYPTVSPDGRWLAYTRSDGRSDVQLRLSDLETGESRELGRTNGLATFAWMPDGRLLVAQFELDGPYRSWQDLWVFDLDGGQERITEKARVEQPSVMPDGMRAVAVRQGGGTNGLVVVDLASGAISELVAPEPDVHWAFPRVSPDGRWIAATRWTPGAEHDVVLLDARTGALVDRVTQDRAMDLAPSWSPDGRWVVWGSDRSGIPNVLASAVDPATGRAAEPVRLTNLRTGAGYPSIGPDGETVYFSGYHVDGWEVERVPFRPGDARRAEAPAERFRPTMPQPTRGEAGGAVEPYSPMSTLLPTYWEVSYREPLNAPAAQGSGVTVPAREVLGFSLGLETSGRDLVGRHAWSAVARMSTTGARFDGGAAYAFLGLGNPLLSLSARQTYPDASQLLVDPDPDTLVLLTRRREVAAAVSVLVPTWRRDVSITFRGGLAWERRELLDPRLRASTQYRLDRPMSRLATYGATIGVSTARSHAFQMGLARGLSLSVFGGIEQDLSVPDSLSGVAGADGTYGEVRGQLRAAIPLWGGGFARHTLALRGSGGVASGPGAGPFLYRVGGASGRLEDLTGLELFGGTPIFFPVRGYPTSSRFGRYAWSATAEYRFPIWLGNVGLGPWPLHLDRTIGSIFFDAGNAWGPDASFTGLANPLRTALASVGAEITTEFLGLYDVVLRVRAGGGVPLVEGDGPRFWVRVGLPF